MASIKTNVLLNYINTITGIIFPVITFPYASRILLPDGIGVVNFLNSIINYIVLFTSLGIPLYAVKEIARHRDDIHSRNKTTIEIGLLGMILCAFGYVAVFLLSVLVPRISANRELFYILSSAIFFTSIGANWFYQAIEDFKFITLRTVIFRTLSAIGLFVFVKDKGDLLIYATVNVMMSVGSNCINFVHLRKYISLSTLKGVKLELFKHLKPALHIFVLNLIISIYVQLNSVMLGFIDSDYAVGIYTAGHKIPHMFLSVVTSMGAVLLPRCSNLVAKGDMSEFANVITKSIRLVLFLALPISLGLILLAEPVITIFCGASFAESVNVLYWTCPIIVFIGLTNVIGIQMLYPLGKENIVIYSTLGGAIVNATLNFMLIPHLSAVGAGIATFAAELTVLIIQWSLCHKYIDFKLLDKRSLNYLIASLLMTAIVLPIVTLLDGLWLKTVLAVITGALTYITYLFVRKDEMLLNIMDYLLRR